MCLKQGLCTGLFEYDVLERRIRKCFGVLEVNGFEEAPLRVLLAQVEVLLGNRRLNRQELVWLFHVVFMSYYGSQDELSAIYDMLLIDGPEHVVETFIRNRQRARNYQWTVTADLEFVTEPFVEVTSTSEAVFQSGIQRVVRETLPRWLKNGYNFRTVFFYKELDVWGSPDATCSKRVFYWERFDEAPDPVPMALRAGEPAKILIPWKTTIIMPDFGSVPTLMDVLTATGQFSDNILTLILFDLIPMTRPKDSPPDVPESFAKYITLLRETRRLSCISESVRVDAESLATMLDNQGISAPSTKAHSLPVTSGDVDDLTVKKHVDVLLHYGSEPLVLSVSSIEPRKNHVRILEAAELLWQTGLKFQLLFIGGNGWKADRFLTTFDMLRNKNRHVRVIRGASEDILWSAYKLARFSVFVSMTEGFGLPAAESISMGIPVVLSGHGSMREIGAGGGAEFVNAYDVDDIACGMRTLLVDDVRLHELRVECQKRQDKTWEEYARETWSWLSFKQDNN
jgi:glycosyltransferase involved in cell wall biosynthesis